MTFFLCASFSESGKSPLSNDKLIMLAMTGASSLAHFFKRLVGTGSRQYTAGRGSGYKTQGPAVLLKNFSKTEWQEEGVTFEQSSNIKLLELNSLAIFSILSAKNFEKHSANCSSESFRGWKYACRRWLADAINLASETIPVNHSFRTDSYELVSL